MFEPLQYTEALGLTSSRSSDYSLVKELLRSQTSADDFHRLCRAFPDPVPVRGGGIIASAVRLSTGVVGIAHVTFARRKRPRQPVPKASVSRCCVSNERSTMKRPSSGTRANADRRMALLNRPDYANEFAVRQGRRRNSFRHDPALNLTTGWGGGSRRREKSRPF